MIPICLFFGESERKKQKKYDTKVCMKDEEKCSYSWWWFFSKKLDYLYRKKHIIAFWMTASLVWVQGGGTNH